MRRPHQEKRPYQVDVPEGRSGLWSVEKFTVSAEEARHDSAMSAIRGSSRHTPAGTYTGLYRKGFHINQPGDIIMSDTPDEYLDHADFIRAAHGNVLIAGLGLGMVLQEVCRRVEVQSVTVVEKSPDVIALVGPTYKKRYPHKLNLVEADIFTWEVRPRPKFDITWFDIWDNLCTDNLDEMAKLNRKYARWCSDKRSWGREILLDRRRRERDAPWNRPRTGALR